MEMAVNAGVASVYLKPGELYIAESPALVYTVLGSCVAVTMHSMRLSVGAICHAMLPEGGAHCEHSRPGRKGEKSSFRYVDLAVEHMVERLSKLGADTQELEVRVIGGSTMVANRHDLKIGRLNSKKAYELLEAKGLEITEYAVGGTLGRKVYYNTQTGEVFWNWIKKRSEQARPETRLRGYGKTRHTGGDDE